MNPNYNHVPFVSVDQMMQLVTAVGIEKFMTDLASFIKADFERWKTFDKTPRVASHSRDGVIELMPTCDGELYGFKYVNGHPLNTKTGRQTVTAFGVLADAKTGYPVLLTEMTLLTAFRTAAMSALAALYLAPKNSHTMAIIGNGAQSEFQALAFKVLLGTRSVRLFDIDRPTSLKCARNLSQLGFSVTVCGSVEESLEGAQIITTITADKKNATILSDNHIGSGVHINAVGGDCPGKTELHQDILRRSDIFVEYTPQTQIEGEIQQLSVDHPVTELWQVISGLAEGRRSVTQNTIFDSVGFAIEDFSALRYIKELCKQYNCFTNLDLLADPDDPRDLYGMLVRYNNAKLSHNQMCHENPT